MFFVSVQEDNPRDLASGLLSVRHKSHLLNYLSHTKIFVVPTFCNK